MSEAWQHLADIKFNAVIGPDEPKTATTTINGNQVAVSRAEIRNELRAELRRVWATTELEGKLTPRLKAILKEAPGE